MIFSILTFAALHSHLIKGAYWSFDPASLNDKHKICVDNESGRGFRVLAANTSCSSDQSAISFYTEYYMDFDQPTPRKYLNCKVKKHNGWYFCDVMSKNNDGFQKIQFLKCDKTWLIGTIYYKDYDGVSKSLVELIENQVKLSCP
jgi:hypothetical protein